MKLDRRSTIPLYAQLKELLSDRIRAGDYAPGEKIPSELAFCKELDLSRPTVRQAISELVTEGILIIVKGKGTFVAPEPEKIELKGFNAFAFSFLSARELDGLHDLTVEMVEADSETGRLFDTAGGTGHAGYWKIQWQLTDEDRVFALCQSLIPVYMFPELGNDLKQKRRMIEITANKYAYLPQRANCKIAVRPADHQEARELDIARNSPVLVSTSRLVSRSGNVCEVVRAVMRADLVTIRLDAGRS
ncbi:MAG: GntR family transcriptional regulator [Saccharofermentanales bacterium]|jgi:GntR family transcriptional regulator|nr:GntR family transcriptional regulator [Clostridiaceae bacterium]